ncbi:MAG TPA: GNAT family N-acetyltransferase [Solirubrobacteraceae bacterium]|nr:GNAT family N-acetyltransferase [Solirubrobacteraceae bacterium]
MQVRELARADWSAVLMLNQASVQELSPLDEQRLAFILELAHRSFVAENEGQVAAFAIAVAPGTAYDSANYHWFAERYESFLYLDRIAVDAAHRRRGLGALLYDAMEQAALPFGRMVCDVNVKPRNDASLAFHAARGYEDIGRLQHGDVKTVALMRKELSARA